MTAYWVSSGRYLAHMIRTPTILHGLLAGVSQERAQAATDGPDGWSVVQIVCHLRDFEGFFRGRVELMLNQDNPVLPAYDHEALAIERDYQNQDLRAALATLLEERRAYHSLFSSLRPEQWERVGQHPEAGPMSVLDAAIQVASHDVDHIEQIARCLDLAPRLL